MVFDGRVYQNAAVLCRKYSISKTLVTGQQRYAEGKSFLDCFRLVKQPRYECGWPAKQIFSYIPRYKIEEMFYKRLSNFLNAIGMPEAQITTYKTRHYCRELIKILQKMQRDYIPAYKTGYGLLSYTQAQQMHYSYEEIIGFPCIKEGIPRYPKLQGFDFEKDCMNTLYRGEDLFEKKRKPEKRS